MKYVIKTTTLVNPFLTQRCQCCLHCQKFTSLKLFMRLIECHRKNVLSTLKWSDLLGILTNTLVCKISEVHCTIVLQSLRFGKLIKDRNLAGIYVFLRSLGFVDHFWYNLYCMAGKMYLM